MSQPHATERWDVPFHNDGVRRLGFRGDSASVVEQLDAALDAPGHGDSKELAVRMAHDAAPELYPTSSTTTSGMKPRRRSSASSLRARLASPRRATHSVAVANWTRWPARQARIEIAIARCVLPVPGG
jgi:hypothetical protein